MGEDTILIQNLGDVAANTDFTLDIELTTTTTVSSLSPTVSIVAFYDYEEETITDKIDNSPFSPATLSNTNLKTFTSFSVADPQVIERTPEKGYFGPLLINFKPGYSISNSNGYYLIIKTTN